MFNSNKCDDRTIRTAQTSLQIGEQIRNAFRVAFRENFRLIRELLLRLGFLHQEVTATSFASDDFARTGFAESFGGGAISFELHFLVS